jgi:hypothetical protein
MELLLYFGVFNLCFIPLAIYFLWLRNNKFSLVNYPISYTGTTHTKKHFVFLTALGTLIELLFVVYFLIALELISNSILLILLVVGFTGIFLTAITPSGRPRLHRAGITIMIVAMTIWSFYLHYLLLPYSTAIAYIGFVLSIATILGVPYFYFYIRSKGLTELFFIAVVLLWNIFMTYFLLTSNVSLFKDGDTIYFLAIDSHSELYG